MRIRDTQITVETREGFTRYYFYYLFHTIHVRYTNTSTREATQFRNAVGP